MLLNSKDIIKTKEYIEVMQAFLDGKKIEYRPKFSEKWMKVTTPTWNFHEYEYRKAISEPEDAYPIYKRLKTTPETVVKFMSLDFGFYVSTHNNSIYIPGDAAFNIAPHTDSSWEDYHVSADAEKAILNEENTIESFEVMIYFDTAEDFKINGTLYSNEELEHVKHYQKTGRSFIVNKETRQIIKVNHN